MPAQVLSYGSVNKNASDLYVTYGMGGLTDITSLGSYDYLSQPSFPYPQSSPTQGARPFFGYTLNPSNISFSQNFGQIKSIAINISWPSQFWLSSTDYVIDGRVFLELPFLNYVIPFSPKHLYSFQPPNFFECESTTLSIPSLNFSNVNIWIEPSQLGTNITNSASTFVNITLFNFDAKMNGYIG